MRYTPPSSHVDPLARIRAHTREHIADFGFTTISVGGGECSVPGCESGPERYPYAYTLGMCDYASPEFVTLGLSNSHVASVVDPVCEAVMRARRMPVGAEHRIELPDGPVISLVAVPGAWVEHDPGRVAAWFTVYEPRSPSYVQIFWADEGGHMPWESECNPAVAALQPVLADDPISVPPR